MAFELKMPKLGESVTEGTIGKWLKQPGDKVNKYDLLVEVQTDKVNTEIPSPVAGTLKEVKVEEVQTVPIGTLLAVFDTADGEAAAQPTSSTQPQPSSQPPAAAPKPSQPAGAPPASGRSPSERGPSVPPPSASQPSAPSVPAQAPAPARAAPSAPQSSSSRPAPAASQSPSPASQSRAATEDRPDLSDITATP